MISIINSAPLLISIFAILVFKYSEAIIALLILGTFQNLEAIVNINFDPKISISILILSSLSILILINLRKVKLNLSLASSIIILFFLIVISSSFLFDLKILSTKDLVLFCLSIILPFFLITFFEYPIRSYFKVINFIFYICLATTIIISPVAYDYLSLGEFLTYDDSWKVKYEQSGGVVILQSLYLSKITGLLVIYLFFYFSVYRRSLTAKIFIFIGLIWTILIMSLINQKMPVIAIIMSPILFVFYIKYFLDEKLLDTLLKLRLNILIFISISIIIIFIFVISAYSFRFNDITMSSHRIAIFVNYFSNFELSYLLTGHGYGYSTLMSNSSSVHNLSLEILMDFGLIALLLYYSLILLATYKSHKIITSPIIDITTKRVTLILLNIFLYLLVLSQFSGNLISNYNQFIIMILIFGIYSAQGKKVIHN